MIDLDTLVLQPCVASWGEAVRFLPVAGVPQAVDGVFQEKYKSVTFENGDEVQASKPVLGCRASAFTLAEPAQGDQFLIRGRLWAVTDIEPDGQGHLHISLRLANDQQVAIAPTVASPVT